MPRKRAAQPTNAGNRKAKKRITASVQDDAVDDKQTTAGRVDAASSPSAVTDTSSITEAKSEQLETTEQGVTTVRGQSRPSFVLPPSLNSHPLHDRLKSFLPELARSNGDLVGKSLEDVDVGEEHISMELGLGVLEQQVSDSGSDGTDSSAAPDDDAKVVDNDHLRRLLGQSTPKDKAHIQEVG